MNKEIIDDLKQFITTTVSRIVSEKMSGLATKDELKDAVSELATKEEMGTRFDILEYKIDNLTDDLRQDIKKVDKRLTGHIAATAH
jgi:tRNA(Ser,Leu) C12 N-acetylase TAN1